MHIVTKQKQHNAVQRTEVINSMRYRDFLVTIEKATAARSTHLLSIFCTLKLFTFNIHLLWFKHSLFPKKMDLARLRCDISHSIGFIYFTSLGEQNKAFINSSRWSTLVGFEPASIRMRVISSTTVLGTPTLVLNSSCLTRFSIIRLLPYFFPLISRA